MNTTSKKKEYLFSLLEKKEEINVTELSVIFKVSRQTIYNWKKKYYYKEALKDKTINALIGDYKKSNKVTKKLMKEIIYIIGQDFSV